MIKISVKRNNNLIDEISIKGHAMYDDFGKDIVCASVSSIVITTVNAIERLKKGSTKINEKVFNIKVLNDDSTVQTLLENMISLLKELEESYPKNIKFL